MGQQTGFLLGLRARLMSVALIAILPAVALVVFIADQQRQEAFKEKEAELLTLANLSVEGQRQEVERARQLLIGLAELEAVRRHDTPACEKSFSTMFKLQSANVENIVAAKANGDILCRGRTPTAEPGGIPPVTNAADQPWFRLVLERRAFFIVGYRIGRTTGQASTIVAYPAIGETGEIRAVIWASLNLSRLTFFPKDVELPGQITITALSPEGTILLRHPGGEELVGQAAPESFFPRRLLGQSEVGSIEVTGPDGRPHLAGYARLGGEIPERDVWVLISAPKEAVYAQADRGMWLNLGALGLAALLAMAGAYVIGDALVTRRVKALVTTTNRLASGETQVRNGPPYPRGEFGELGQAFDRMADSLERRLEDLQAMQEFLRRARDELEIRVRERTVELALAKEEADRANQAKSEFLSRMSHELRTPLNAVLGFAQLLEMDHLTPDQVESVGHIVKGGRHLLDLINEVLDISRIESGRLQLSPEPVKVGEVVNEAIDLVQALASQRRVELRGDLGQAGELFVLGDRQRLKQVLLNFLSNAVKYNTEGGRVTVSCQEVSGNRLRTCVSDTGAGIPSEKLGRLFQPFERLGAEQRGIEGTGLGLALSKRLVESMMGTVGAESREGEGSIFWLELALVESPVQRLEGAEGDTVVAAQAEAPDKVRTILYVEDNLSNLTLVERVLARRPGTRLLPAMQGEIGLELARQHEIDLVLLDLHLPDIPGEAVLQRLKGDPRTEPIPVAILSADATPGQIERLLAAGAMAYLTKPLDLKQFLQVVEDAFEKRDR